MFRPRVMHSGGRHHPPRPAAENPQVARRSAVGDRQRKASRRYTDRCGTFACRTATVAPGVNAHDERPSVCGATVEGRSAPPSSTAIWRWSADCPPFFEMRRDPGTLPRPPHRDATRPCGRERVRLPIFMERRVTGVILRPLDGLIRPVPEHSPSGAFIRPIMMPAKG